MLAPHTFMTAFLDIIVAPVDTSGGRHSADILSSVKSSHTQQHQVQRALSPASVVHAPASNASPMNIRLPSTSSRPSTAPEQPSVSPLSKSSNSQVHSPFGGNAAAARDGAASKDVGLRLGSYEVTPLARRETDKRAPNPIDNHPSSRSAAPLSSKAPSAQAPVTSHMDGVPVSQNAIELER